MQLSLGENVSLECDLRSVEALSGLFDLSSVLELQERTKKGQAIVHFL